MRVRAACVGVCLAVITASSTSAARPTSEDDDGRSRQEWYGWQILAGDGVVITLGAIGFYGAWKLTETSRGGLALAALGPGAHLLSGPIVHIANDRPWTALASFGVRLGLASPGFAVGGLLFAAASSTSSSDGLRAFALGYMLGAMPGIIAATAIDASVLARKPKKPEQVGFAPAAWPEIGGASVGVVGAF